MTEVGMFIHGETLNKQSLLLFKYKTFTKVLLRGNDQDTRVVLEVQGTDPSEGLTHSSAQECISLFTSAPRKLRLQFPAQRAHRALSVDTLGPPSELL